METFNTNMQLDVQILKDALHHKMYPTKWYLAQNC